MGRNSWLDVVKKAFTSPNKHTTKMIKARRREEHEQDVDEDKKRSKRRWIFKKTTTIVHDESKNSSATNDSITGAGNSATNLVSQAAYSDQKHAVAAAEAAIEVVRLTRPPFSFEKHKAALVIQTSFRGYLARRALQALKGVVKLQALVRGHNVRKRAKTTLKCMQALVRVQAQVCDRRKKLSNEGSSEDSVYSDSNSVLRSHHLADHSKSITREESSFGTEDEWDEHAYRIEEIQAMLQKTEVAAQKAFVHQIWRSHRDECRGQEGLESNGRRDRMLSLDQREPVKTVNIDSSQCYFLSPSCQRSHNQTYNYQRQKLNSNPVSSPLHRAHQNLYPQSPITPSSLSRIKPSAQVYSCSPRCLRGERNLSVSGTGTPTLRGKPSYMAATESAMARVRPQSAPRQRMSTTEGEKKRSARKRLSFSVSEKYNGGGVSDSELDRNLRSPIHMTERRLSMSSCCKERIEDQISRPSITEDRRWFR